MAKQILTSEQTAARKAYNAKWHAANKEKVAARIKKQRSASPEKYAAKCAEWRSLNPDKVAEYSVVYYEKHKEKILANLKESRPGNAKVLAARYSAWRIANRDKVNAAHVAWCAANPKKVNAWRSAWTAANPDRKRVYHVNRKSRKKARGGKLSTGLAARLMILQAGKCACCKKSLKAGYHLDHIMPLALGGSNTDANMQLLTPLCNMQKSKKHPVDFMRSRGLLL